MQSTVPGVVRTGLQIEGQKLALWVGDNWKKKNKRNIRGLELSSVWTRGVGRNRMALVATKELP